MHANHELLTLKKERLSNLFLKGFIAASNSHNTLKKNPYSEIKDEKTISAFAYLTEAHTYFVSAETLLFENSDIDDAFKYSHFVHRFNEFNKELLKAASTGDGHQTTTNEFYALVESFKEVSALLLIENADHWVKNALNEGEKW